MNSDFDFDPLAYLENLSSQQDEDIDLAEAALALAAMDHEGINLSRYFHHLRAVGDDVASCFRMLIEKGGVDSPTLRLRALVHVLADEYGYIGDTRSYDDLQNASLIKVIDRAKGLPITLSILYIHAARVQRWDIAGLNFPGHFVCRIEHEGERLIFDPFNGGDVLEAPDLRSLAKKALGPHAELSGEYYEPATNRDILVRLQNNIKHRKVEAEDYEGALTHVERMRKIDPGDYRLLLDAGILYAKTDQARAAIETLSAYVDKAPHGRDRHEAELLLQELSQRLN